MNLLNDYPQVRKYLYLAQWFVNLVLGAMAIVLTSMGKSPEWFVITGAVFNFVWTYTGIVAQTNVNPAPAPAPAPPPGP